MTATYEPKPCRYGCGKKLVFNPDLGGVPFEEQDSKIHHTYQRCAELLGPEKATVAFSKDAKERRQAKQ